MSIGNVYIADTYNNRIRKETVSTGIITTIAGTGTGSYSGDEAAATSATLYYPSGVVLDSSGIQYYFLTFINICNSIFLPYTIQATCTSLIVVIIVSVR